MTLKYLIDCDIFSITNYALTFKDAVINKEILMSRKIIENDWNIRSLLKLYNNVDFTFKTKKPEDYILENITFYNDILYDNFYQQKLWVKEEIIFVKGNRNINI